MFGKSWQTRWDDAVDYLNTAVPVRRLGAHIESVVTSNELRKSISKQLSLGTRADDDDVTRRRRTRDCHESSDHVIAECLESPLDTRTRTRCHNIDSYIVHSRRDTGDAVKQLFRWRQQHQVLSSRATESPSDE